MYACHDIYVRILYTNNMIIHILATQLYVYTLLVEIRTIEWGFLKTLKPTFLMPLTIDMYVIG